MRELTIHERISMRGILAKYGLRLPILTMTRCLYLWPICCGTKITDWVKQTIKPNRLHKWHDLRRYGK